MVYDDTFDIYILMRPFREIVAELRHLLEPLHSLEQRLAAGAEGYYAPRLDTALLAIRFDRAQAATLGHARLRSLVASVGLPIITPEALSFEHRCQFFLEHLANYTTYVQQYRSRDERSGLIDRVIAHLAEHAEIPLVDAVHHGRHASVAS